MRNQSIKHLMLGLAIGIAALALSGEARAQGSLTVAAGYDLFTTEPDGTTFPGLGNLMGVPLGTYNFGSGPVSVGTADTIIQRTDTVTVGASGDTGTTGLVMNALQLETVAPVNFGGVVGDYFVTLQSTRGGPASTGSMSITFGSPLGGTFTSSLDVFFDIHFGSLTGPIVYSSDLVLTNSGDTWGRTPPIGAELINGINYLLDGKDTNQDFWPGVPLIESHPNGAMHTVTYAMTPEPSTWVMLITAGVLVPAYAGWRRRRA